MKLERKHLIARVAYLYYVKGFSQDKISKNLNIYRTTVSRMLKQARDNSLVKVNIDIDQVNTDIFDLELKVKETFGLKNVLIVPTNNEDSDNEKDEKLAYEAALYLKQIIKPESIIGFSWGNILARMAGKLHNLSETSSVFVPLAGGPSSNNTTYHVNSIVYDASKHFGGQGLYVNVSAIQESKLKKKQIMNSLEFYKIKEYWKKLDIAVVGIGGPLNSAASSWRDLLSTEDFELLNDREVVGDCCCTFFDKYGKILRGDLWERTIAIPIENLKNVKDSVGVARSLTKAPSLAVLMKMKILNTLITDEETARHILELI